MFHSMSMVLFSDSEFRIPTFSVNRSDSDETIDLFCTSFPQILIYNQDEHSRRFSRKVGVHLRHVGEFVLHVDTINK